MTAAAIPAFNSLFNVGRSALDIFETGPLLLCISLAFNLKFFDSSSQRLYEEYPL